MKVITVKILTGHDRLADVGNLLYYGEIVTLSLISADLTTGMRPVVIVYDDDHVPMAAVELTKSVSVWVGNINMYTVPMLPYFSGQSPRFRKLFPFVVCEITVPQVIGTGVMIVQNNPWASGIPEVPTIPGTIVEHAEFSEINPVPERYGIGDLQSTLNQVLAILQGTQS
jgi:hypothetical protein